MDKIVLGSGRRKKQDFQYYKQVKSHLEEIEGKVNKSMVRIGKADVDKFPHQCRYYKPCQEIVINPSGNYGHFKRVHPWTEDEQEFLLTLFEESPTGKNIYLLSVLYGRSEEELRNFFKSQNKKLPKWGKREKEISEVHEVLNTQIQEIRTNNRIKIVKDKNDNLMDRYWENEVQVGMSTVVSESESDSFSELINPFPVNPQEIQSQNYLTATPTPPDAIGSKDFYKNTVDALLEKHRYWIAEEQRLKNRIQELDNQIIELRNKLDEKINEPELSEEEIADYKEQMNSIYQGF